VRLRNGLCVKVLAGTVILSANGGMVGRGMCQTRIEMQFGPPPER
jgi:hypothetical protein